MVGPQKRPSTRLCPNGWVVSTGIFNSPLGSRMFMLRKVEQFCLLRRVTRGNVQVADNAH